MDISRNLSNIVLKQPFNFKFGYFENNSFFSYQNQNDIWVAETDEEVYKKNFINSNFRLETFEDEQKYIKELYLISNVSDKKERNCVLNEINKDIINEEKKINEQKLTDVKIEINKVKKIFSIKKIKYKNMGRRNRNCIYQTEAHHGKTSEDNIIRKAKIYFINASLRYINNKYSEFIEKKLNKKSKKKLLQKLKPDFTKYLKKIDEQNFLNKTLSEILKGKVSTRCSKHKSNYNEIQIEKIIKENEQLEIIKLLNKTVKDAYEIYIGKSEIINDFNINNDLKKIETKNGKEYTKMYKDIALELLYLIKKKGRKE